MALYGVLNRVLVLVGSGEFAGTVSWGTATSLAHQATSTPEAAKTGKACGQYARSHTLASRSTASAFASSDVISDLRINVFEESSDKIIWYKERFLSDEEIVEHLVHNQTSTILWTIHKPKRGWYIRIRSPSFPPGVFMPLLPVPRSSPDYADAALYFSCRTNNLPLSPPSTSISPKKSGISRDSVDSDTTVVHSYPPTPPVAPIVTPPSPRSLSTKLDEIGPSPANSARTQAKPIPSRIAQFLLAPHSTPHIPIPQQTDQTSFITRAVSLFKNHKPSHSLSFTLTPVDNIRRLKTAGSSQSHHLIPQSPTPLLVFHDTTPVLTFRSMTGLLEINRAEEHMLGVETSFWIAVSLSYLEFLEDRESYLAAMTD
ncbi:hypothetical protein EDD17DRAFT_1603735 [Pisolithus thermaeus]|nr:hypothetical protein EDD17DRAFT_1603735 [Pisolithus thermaeus]